MVAINTTPAGIAPRQRSIAQWINRTQEVLAHRSLQGQTFHRLYTLCCTKRLIEHALMKVLRNTGAQTAGVDGITKHKLSSDDQLRLIDEIWQEMKAKTYRPAPVRRVYIPKSNGKQRPLGIPTIKDRVVQEMLRLILEPIYEPKFYRHSYGFRPFRSAHHAALRIKDLIGKRGYTIAIEGDIKACFDQIHHAKLLRILRRTIKDERIIRLIRDMLRAGVMENGTWQATEYGSPQGGIVSPLLANIYLTELDTFIAKKWDYLMATERQKQRYHKIATPCFITRYADDFVVMVQGDRAMAERLKDELATFLHHELHLELSAEKTLITPVAQGIDFLGFTIRKYRNATLITPSRKALAKFKEQVKKRAWVGFSDTDAAGIVLLNRYIIGWGQYYRRVSSTRAFRYLDHYLWWRVMRTTYRLRVRRRKLTFAQHYRRHTIRYRYDLNKKNRWRRGSHYGVWLDEQRSVALIIARLAFLPITYVRLHSQLNPYIPAERVRLEQQQAVITLLADIERNQPMVNRDYGPEWASIRRQKLAAAGYHCERCGTPIQGRRATVHHKIPLKHARSRRQAHRLENLISLCPSCHALMEREEQNGKARA